MGTISKRPHPDPSLGDTQREAQTRANRNSAYLVVEDVGHGGGTHRQTGVARLGLVDTIDGQETDGVDALVHQLILVLANLDGLDRLRASQGAGMELSGGTRGVPGSSARLAQIGRSNSIVNRPQNECSQYTTPRGAIRSVPAPVSRPLVVKEEDSRKCGPKTAVIDQIAIPSDRLACHRRENIHGVQQIPSHRANRVPRSFGRPGRSRPRCKGYCSRMTHKHT